MRTSLNKTTEFTNLSVSKIIGSKAVGKDILIKNYANNAAAVAAGLVQGDLYHSNNDLKIVINEFVDPVFSGEIPTGNLGQEQLPPLPPSPWVGGGTKTSGNQVAGFTMTGGTSGATANVSVWIILGLVAVDVQLVNSQTFVVGETVSIPAYTCAGCGDSEWTAPLTYTLVAEDFINV